MLFAIEGDVVFRAAHLLAVRLHIEKPLTTISPFLIVFSTISLTSSGFTFCIEDAFGQYGDKGAYLAETLAAAPRYEDAVFFLLQFHDRVETRCPRSAFTNCLIDLQGAVDEAACTCADDDPARGRL